MASSTTATAAQGQDKTVTGFPAHHNHVAAGYPPGTAYPYAVPPPPTYSNIYVEPTPNPRFYNPPSRHSTLFCRLLTAAAVVFAIVGLIFFITWLVLKPRLPHFRVESATVTSLNATGAELTARWDITLSIRNPNRKLAIYYDSLDAKVSYGDYGGLATTHLPPFIQETQNETRVRAQLSVIDEYVDNDVVKDIAAERAVGSVKFGVTVLAWIRFRTGVWRTRDHVLRVYCDPINISFSNNNGTGSLMGPSNSCLVN
ncbi:hypothetical protein L6164_009559 [Bauhinia variegata]|uniref:Uncharacterized protein n=1 Tax=Bauhinia variegata TaxID=167791 RepID=A0ACB9PKH0_BAUVA|nr:hypothetical protein L6164_009559 [Bauhinia variegata]